VREQLQSTIISSNRFYFNLESSSLSALSRLALSGSGLCTCISSLLPIMGIGDAYDEHDNHDEHLYSRRASKNSLYSAASGSTHPSSPTFSSRRGSAVTVNLHGDSDPDAHQRNTAYPRTRHNGEFDNPYLIHGLPSPSRSSRYAHHDEIVGNRNAHAHASGSLHSNTPANYDGIIKHPSRYPYARSHHHHPYAHAYSYYSSSGRSPSFSHSSPQPAREHPLSTSQHNDNIDDAFAHPRSHPHPYYSQKRHSLAALRTATAGAGSSSSFNTGGGGGSGINGMSPLNGPVVRLPSIDHGLPPFSGTEGSMVRFTFTFPDSIVQFCRLSGCVV
jgi:hypothetical protein